MHGRDAGVQGYDRPMELYGQDAEVDLLARILPRLETRSVVDVGAERGSFAKAMLRAGATEVHAIEPEPRNLEFLRERFAKERRVAIHDCAVSDADGDVDLYIATDPRGAPVTFAHSLRRHADSDQIVWHDRIPVRARSLASLVAADDIPGRIGILKVDAEGHDLAVLVGLGELDCDVVMTEHWLDLPHSAGPCPWTIDGLLAALSPRGFDDYAYVVHRGEATIVQWNDARIPVGDYGNLLFFHERVVGDLLPLVLESASTLARSVVELAERRLGTVDEVDRERQLQASAAEERLSALELLDRERAQQTAIAAERLREIERLEQGGGRRAE